MACGIHEQIKKKENPGDKIKLKVNFFFFNCDNAANIHMIKNANVTTSVDESGIYNDIVIFPWG